MSRRGWILFLTMSGIWGVPYLLIKVAVEELAPPVVVAGRTGVSAAVLLVVAARRDALRPLVKVWKPMLAFTVLEMGIPWLLLTDAERRLPSGLTGLLVAAVPLVGTVLAYLLGDHHALRPQRLVGLVVGLSGVALLVGFGGDGGTVPIWSVVEVLVVAVGYASAPFIASRALNGVPTIGVVAASLGLVFVAYLPGAVLTRPDHVPSLAAVGAVLGLAVLCTGIAFLVFFALIDEVGPDRATLITFLNPAVAVVLGVAVLGEALTPGILAGFPIVLVGCWLATRKPASTEPLAIVADH